MRRAIHEKLKHISQLKHAALDHWQLEVPARRRQRCENTNENANENARPTLQWTLPSNAAFMQQQEEEGRKLADKCKIALSDTDFVTEVKLIPATSKGAAKIEFQLRPDAFTKQILSPGQPALPADPANSAEHVVVEFSSPNIAKPFHVGHLRSTIIGNVLTNLHEHLGYRTSKLNYLGDWGTQFGLLALGVQLTGLNDSQMRAAPIESLYRAYVLANRTAENDGSFATRARELFTQLETGEDQSLALQWQRFREYTIDELSQVYARLGVHFDYYDWESQYSQREIGQVLERLRAAGLLLREQDQREIVQVGERRVPIIKSDGSTLYLARDIAALLERYQRFQFSRILYVVDNAQTDHFKALFSTTAALSNELSTPGRLVHVKFGRIHGMSTRQGKAIFLRDVLNEARDIMREKRHHTATTKANDKLADEEVCDILGVSAVVINDLKQRRQRDYEFNWQQALQMHGDTGIKLQYTHCRLHSLLAQAADVDLSRVEPSWALLAEPEAQDLLFELARFEQCVCSAQRQLEACVLVNYLFALCNATSRALKHLPVKHEPVQAKQAQRLLLFHAAKRTLHQGMCILGLQPLNQM